MQSPWRPLSHRLVAGLLSLCVLFLAAGAGPAQALEVNVNAASIEDLRSLRGVGPQLAERILRERARGPYRDLEDLRSRVRGLGERTVRKLVQQGLRVRPAATAPRLSDNPRPSPALPPPSARP